jgi:hypothetical protein
MTADLIRGFITKSKDPDPTFINRVFIRFRDLLIRIRRANKPTYPVNPDPEHWLL